MILLVYILTLAAYLGTSILSIDLGFIQVSPYRVLLLFIIFLLLVLCIATNPKITIRDFQYPTVKYIGFYLVWFLYSLFTVVWVFDRSSWLKSSYFIGNGLLAILILYLFIRKEAELRAVFYLSYVMVIVHNLIGWFEIYSGKYLFADLSIIDKYDQFGSNPNLRTPISIFANANNFATFLIGGMAIALLVFKVSKSVLIKYSSLLVMASSSLLIFKSLSRANLIALVIGITTLVVLNLFDKKNVSGILGVGALSLIAVFNIERIFLLVHSFIGDATIHIASGSDRTRTNLIKTGFDFLVDTFGFGVGAGNIEYWVGNRGTMNVHGITNMHNWWMEILVGYGVIIFVGYIAVYLHIFFTLVKYFRITDDPFIKDTSSVFIGFMVAFIVAAMSASSLISAEWLFFFWGIIITFIGYCERTVNNRTS